MDAYLTTGDARTLAATIGVTLPADDGALAALLLLATLDIDRSMRFQGQKYDPQQALEFPRRFRRAKTRFPLPTDPMFLSPHIGIWDWDATANSGAGAAVAPVIVKYAVIHQASWLQKPEFAKRIEAIRSGLKGQKIGTASEEYQTPDELDSFGLSDRATRLMETYRLRSGSYE